MGTLKTLLFTALWLWASGAAAQTANAMGDAVVEDDECYTVTLPIEWQNGAVWFLETIDLGEPFTIDLKLNFGFIDANGADGVVFVMQTSGTTLLGEPGGGLGFGGISPSFGVEFDTFQNNDYGDIWQDHIAMVSDGSVLHSSANNLAGPVTALASGANIEDGNDHLFRLVWNPDADVVEVYSQPRIVHEAAIFSAGGDSLKLGWSLDLTMKDPATGQAWDLSIPSVQTRVRRLVTSGKHGS